VSLSIAGSTSYTTRLLAGLALAISLFGSTATLALARPGGKESAPDPRVAQIEVDFLRGMIPHHRGAMKMAMIARDRAARAETRELAQQIIDEQEQEVILMTAYLRDWYGMAPPEGDQMPPEIMERMDMPMLRGLMPDMEARMVELEAATGDEVDIVFMSTMIDHHSMAIMMAAPTLLTAYHAELYQLAGQVAASQGEQIMLMQQRLQAWYGLERPEEHFPPAGQ